jgi:hypothetical protein
LNPPLVVLIVMASLYLGKGTSRKLGAVQLFENSKGEMAVVFVLPHPVL